MPVLREVHISQNEKQFSAYAELLSSRSFARFRANAKDLGSLSVIHINATRIGGGVAEILDSQVPLERDLGLDSRRFFIDDVPAEFFVVTKKMHNFLQGRGGVLSDKEKALYTSVNAELAPQVSNIIPTTRRCVVVVHDPQPAPLLSALPPKIPSMLRLHMDLSTPNPGVIEFFRPSIQKAGRVIVSNAAYLTAMPWLKRGQAVVSYPAIDPFTEKNRSMPLPEACTILGGFGINADQPLVAQVSRFDPWKDPLGVIRAYYLAKRDIPNLQLLLAGLVIAQDDPEAISVFAEVSKHAEGDPDIFLFADPTRLADLSNDIFINAVYTASTLIIQKSIREGFGLTMTEAMWKEKAVIAGNTTGAAVQIVDGKTGIIVSSPEEAAEAIVRLVRDEDARTRLGRAAHAAIKRKFLMPRLLADFLKLYAHAMR